LGHCQSALKPLYKRKFLYGAPCECLPSFVTCVDPNLSSLILWPWLMLFFHLSGVGGHFNHPYGREWAKIQDLATPLLAELVGKSHQKHHWLLAPEIVLPYRCPGKGSCLYGYFDYKPAPHDEHVLQAYTGPIQDFMRSEGISFRSGKLHHLREKFFHFTNINFHAHSMRSLRRFIYTAMT
jgi:hypothetical protein